MFDIGFGEMVLLAAIALIAIGPKQLPEVARALGKLLGEMKKTMGEVTSTVANAREETDKAIRKVTDDLVSGSQQIGNDIGRGLSPEIQKHEHASPIVPLPDHPGDPPWVVNPAIPNPHDKPASVIPDTGAAPFAMAPAKAYVPPTGKSDGSPGSSGGTT